MTSDITRPADDKNVHAGEGFIAFARLLASDFLVAQQMSLPRIVITGIGLTAPNGNSLKECRGNLLAGVAGIEWLDVRYMGRLLAGVCHYDPLRYQTKKEVRVGTRAGSISIWCASEAIADSGIDFKAFPKDRAG